MLTAETKTDMDTQMNKRWIEHSHLSADHYDVTNNPNLKQVRELDMMGLFETSWMIYKHPGNIYGYPNNE